jgi:hypothetical protein
MRIFNGTSMAIDLPYTGALRVSIPPKSESTELYCDKKFISTLITTYTPEQIALIISGPEEVATCADVPTAVNYVCSSIDDAYSKFVVPDAISRDNANEECNCVKKELPNVGEGECKA